MTVDLHVIQDHLGLTIEGLAAVGAQVFLQHNPDPHETGSQKVHMNQELKQIFSEETKALQTLKREFSPAFSVLSKLIII